MESSSGEYNYVRRETHKNLRKRAISEAQVKSLSEMYSKYIDRELFTCNNEDCRLRRFLAFAVKLFMNLT